MGDIETRKAHALIRLRRWMTSIVTGLVPDLTERPTRATSRVGALPAAGGGEHVAQRVQLELDEPVFRLDDLLAAAHEVWNADGDGVVVEHVKADGAPRVDVLLPCDTAHSATLLHGGRVLQLTSFSAVIGGDNGGPDCDGDAVEETIAGLPGTEDLEAAITEDVRLRGLDLEEERAGGDYGYELQLGSDTAGG